jgi:hypothetical protein
MFTAAHRPHPIVLSCSHCRNFTATVTYVVYIPEANPEATRCTRILMSQSL